jgi:DNA-binding transcriptional regulator YiaG
MVAYRMLLGHNHFTEDEQLMGGVLNCAASFFRRVSISSDGMSDLERQRKSDIFKKVRIGLGLSHSGFADLVEVDPRVVRRWENVERDIPGPVWLVIELLCELPEVRDYLDLDLDPDWVNIDISKKP